FQAEDGIRDFHVTGVQTCALPIFPEIVSPGEAHRECHLPDCPAGGWPPFPALPFRLARSACLLAFIFRIFMPARWGLALPLWARSSCWRGSGMCSRTR